MPTSSSIRAASPSTPQPDIGFHLFLVLIMNGREQISHRDLLTKSSRKQHKQCQKAEIPSLWNLGLSEYMGDVRGRCINQSCASRIYNRDEKSVQGFAPFKSSPAVESDVMSPARISSSP
jgi:hypothetical protein